MSNAALLRKGVPQFGPHCHKGLNPRSCPRMAHGVGPLRKTLIRGLVLAPYSVSLQQPFIVGLRCLKERERCKKICKGNARESTCGRSIQVINSAIQSDRLETGS